MEVYEVFGGISQHGEMTAEWKWTSEGVAIKDRMIPIEDIDWCKKAGANKLKLELRDGSSIFLDYSDEEKDKCKRARKGICKEIDKIDDAKAHQEAKIYCEIFEHMTAYGEPIIKGKWTYAGMLIDSKMIPVEDIEDCRFVSSGFTHYILFELKDGRHERFDLMNEEQYEQGKRAVMMIVNQLRKLESGEWA